MLHYRRAVLHARLGEHEELLAALELHHAYGGSGKSYGMEVPDSLLRGDHDKAVRDLEAWVDAGYAHLTAANFRLNPDFDPLRERPRFRRLLARLGVAPGVRASCARIACARSMSPCAGGGGAGTSCAEGEENFAPSDCHNGARP